MLPAGLGCVLKAVITHKPSPPGVHWAELGPWQQKQSSADRGETTVQLLCFCTSHVRPRNVEPGLSSDLSFLPFKPKAASGRRVQTCWGGCGKMTGAWIYCVTSQAQRCAPSTFQRTLSKNPGRKTSLKPTWICHESVEEIRPSPNP